MSSTQPTDNDDDSYGNDRDRAVRVFAAELNDTKGHTFKESASENAPTYTLLPTGVRANRVLIMGALTQKEIRETDDGSKFITGRVNDGESNYRINASLEYDKGAQMLREIEPPETVAVVGKINHWESDGNAFVEVSKLEAVSTVDKTDRKEWANATAVRTHKRVQQLANTTQEELDAGDAPVDIQRVFEDRTAEKNYPYSGDVDLNKYLEASKEALRTTMDNPNSE